MEVLTFASDGTTFGLDDRLTIFLQTRGTICSNFLRGCVLESNVKMPHRRDESFVNFSRVRKEEGNR